MGALPALLPRSGYAIRWRVGLLGLAVILAAVCSSSSAGNASSRSRSGGPPTASVFPDARTYVDAHNAVRAAVQKPPGYARPWTPVPPLIWSDEVASTAQAWVEHLRDSNDCKLMHSDTRYGENLGRGKDLDAAAAVAMWAKEYESYRYSPTYDFEIVTGHYTQVVWRKTTHIGCGRATCGRMAVIACRYSPAGNRIGSAPY